MLDIELRAGEFEGVTAEGLLARQHLLDVFGRPAIPSRLGEVRPIVGEHGVDPVRNGFDQGSKEIAGHAACGFLVQLGEGELGRPINGHEEIELAFLGSHLGDVDVKEADRLARELGPVRLLTIDVGQARDAVALQAAMQG